jgi:hypothetical protein
MGLLSSLIHWSSHVHLVGFRLSLNNSEIQVTASCLGDKVDRPPNSTAAGGRLYGRLTLKICCQDLVPYPRKNLSHTCKKPSANPVVLYRAERAAV